MKSSMTNCMLDGKSWGYKIVVKMIIVRVHGAHLLNCVVFIVYLPGLEIFGSSESPL